jgi:hypothetical protein
LLCYCRVYCHLLTSDHTPLRRNDGRLLPQLWEVRGLERNPNLEPPADEYYSDSDSEEDENAHKFELDTPSYSPVPGHVAGFGQVTGVWCNGLAGAYPALCIVLTCVLGVAVCCVLRVRAFGRS